MKHPRRKPVACHIILCTSIKEIGKPFITHHNGGMGYLGQMPPPPPPYLSFLRKKNWANF